jgi:hypothetical protein
LVFGAPPLPSAPSAPSAAAGAAPAALDPALAAPLGQPQLGLGSNRVGEGLRLC